MRFLRIGLATLGAGALCLGLTTAASASQTQHVQKAEPDITCASGYSRFWNGEVVDNDFVNSGVTANGIGNPLTDEAPANSCWKAIWPYNDPIGGLGYQYVNEGGNCMWISDGYVKLNTCVDGDGDEQFYGVTNTPDLGWTIVPQGAQEDYMNSGDCPDADGDVVLTAKAIAQMECDNWNP